MPPYIEFEGKNIEGAIAKACETLSVSREELKHEIVSFGSTGIFGLVGFRKARIRVSIPEVTESEQELRTEPETEFPLDVTTTSESPDNEVLDFGGNTIELNRAIHVDVSQDGAIPILDALVGKSADTGRQVLQRMVNAITVGAEVFVSSSDRQIVFVINGGNPAALIGKRGQTFEAIRYLMKQVVNKSAESRMRIVIEITGHTPERQMELQQLARRFAEKACQEGRSITVGRFSPQDRKIIHLALKDDIRIKTQSWGEGFLKKLVVIPRGI